MAKLSSTQIYGDLQVDGEIKNKASTTSEGVVQLNDEINSTSTTQGATANAVKKVNDSLSSHKTDTTSHVTASERTTWNGKANASHTHNYAGSSSVGGSATSALACTGNSATATTLQTARTINGTSFNGSANITTANWGTARTITIGDTAKSVNGSTDVSWSLSEIGALGYKQHPTGTSLDTAFETGTHWIFNATGTLPSGYTTDNDFILQAFRSGTTNTSWQIQLLYDMRANRVFTRRQSSGVFGEWEEITISVGKKGTGSSGEVFNDYTYNVASGEYAHAEGNRCTASAYGAHAEGVGTTASGGTGAHAEGMMTQATSSYAHAEGVQSVASGQASHAEGWTTQALGLASHAEGDSTIAYNGTCHAEGFQCVAGSTATSSDEWGAHAEGWKTTAIGIGSHTEGVSTITYSGSCHAEGYQCVAGSTTSTATVYAAHAEGYCTTAKGQGAHAEGYSTTASALGAHAEGNYAKATAMYSHAEGNGSQATGSCSHSEGYYTVASGTYSHAEGYYSSASASLSHAEGRSTTASGSCSHAEGYCTTAETYALHVQGSYNKVNSGSATTFSSTNNAFVIGNGTSSSALSNAFRVNFSGQTYGLSAFNSTGADYAEYFEWEDGNPNNEDRIGHFVTLDGEKIKFANSENDYIIGIISGNQSIIGNACEDGWNDMYLRDEFGRLQYEEVEVEKEVDLFNEDTNEIEKVMQKVTEKHIKLNPNYDPSVEYKPRSERKEWGIVGMLGQIILKDDGTCKVNRYCKPSENGIATASDNKAHYRVMSRISDNLIKVIMR